MAKLTKKASLYTGEPVEQERGPFFTVSELRKALISMPDDLPLCGENGVFLTWYNVGYDVPGTNGEHLEIEEYDDNFHGWDEEE